MQTCNTKTNLPRYILIPPLLGVQPQRGVKLAVDLQFLLCRFLNRGHINYYKGWNVNLYTKAKKKKITAADFYSC